MGVRLYNPTTGRFLSTDPIRGGNANPYEYCSGDPINCVDLDGRWGKKWKKWGRNAWGFVKRNKWEIGLTALSFVPVAGTAVWAYRSVRAATLAYQGVKRASVGYRAAALAARAGRNRVSITTPRGRYHYDLRGRAHGGVRTPHYTYQPRNPRSPSGWGKTGRRAYPMTHEHLRIVSRHLR
jgi:hypothetical protein